MRQKSILVLIAFILGVAGFSCLDFTKEAPKKHVKKPKVSLPARPNLNIRHPSERYVDNSYSIEGLIKNLETLKGKEAHLTGYVTGRSLCPENEEVACSIEPSILLADYTKGPSKKIRIFVNPGEESRLNDFQIGQKVSVTGTLKMVSPKGTVVEMDGLFVLTPIPVPDADTAKKDNKNQKK